MTGASRAWFGVALAGLLVVALVFALRLRPAAGSLDRAAAAALGLPGEVVVGPGSGDNMGAALGLGLRAGHERRRTSSRISAIPPLWGDGAFNDAAGMAHIETAAAFIRANTLEKFGPVRTVRPELVFELGFEGIQRSARHKSGIAVRFPRMLRIRHDKPLHEANSLQDLELLLKL